MAHWAELNVDNIVLRVVVGSNEQPDEGYQWLIDNLGGTWLKTSYNTEGGVHAEGGTPLRKNFAGIGFTYDSALDAFIAPKPDDFTDEDGNSFTFVLNEETCHWEAIPAP
jgi:hypothetical protein